MRPYLLIAAAVLATAQSAGARQARPGPATYAEAYEAWDRGDYVVALERLKGLVPGADERTFENIALLTGELYQTREVTADGRNPTLSPDGSLILYETGAAAAPQTRVVRMAPGFPVVAEFAGRGAAADATGRRVAYLAGPAAASPLVVRDLATSTETTADGAPGPKNWLVWLPDGGAVVYAKLNADSTATDIFAVTPAGDVRALTTGPGFKVQPRVSGNGRRVMFRTATANPFAPGQMRLAPNEFGIVDAAGGNAQSTKGGSDPSFSPDGTAVVVVSPDGHSESIVMSTPDTGFKAIPGLENARAAAPVFSPDGRKIAFQSMAFDQVDWEIHVANVDGTGRTRVTREIQHDVLPQFLTSDRLLGLVGEPRHRRSYVYDLKTGGRQRLFHNNTVRTIAPEYSWQPTPDGTKVLIQADRDGNTVSPERGVYVVDLTKRISRADLTARLDASLAAERALRAFAARVTTPLASAIRPVVDRASVTRVFGYEKALFDFDSKHITQPGNLKAAEYLHATYASFGYTPNYQWFEPRDAQGNARALGGRTANVLATLKGTVHPEIIYVVSSHYDSVPGGPGADDDSSGTAALLETARIMARHPQPATIVFASFTGEEAGLLGSREFVRRVTEARWNVAGALNNDMIGWANDHRLDNTIRYSNPGIRDIQHAVALTFTDLITYDALYYRGTDAHAFYDAWGDVVGGIGSYPVLGNPHYHQPHDLLDTINHRLVTEVARTTAATLMVLANTPARLKGLTAKAAGTGAVVAWEKAPERDVRQYVVTWQPKGGAAQRMVTTSPSATIANAPAGTEVRVIAVNARGLEGWDHARVIVR